MAPKTASVLLGIIGALLLLGCACSIPTTQAQNRNGTRRVVVIGAGVAGMAAAAKLQSTGEYNVTLLEAAERIGGRTHSFQMGPYHIEIGGEWIHGQKGNSVFEMVEPLGLVYDEISPEEFGDQFGFQTGEILNGSMTHRFEDLLYYLWDDPEDWGSLKKSRSTAMAPEPEPEPSLGEYARMILTRYQEEYGVHPDPIVREAVLDWLHRLNNAEDCSYNWFEKSNTDNGDQYVRLEGHQNVRWKPPYSYASLHQLILTGNVFGQIDFLLPDWVKLNSVVQRIEYLPTDEDTIQVHTVDGASYTADHVIFTPSLGVLKADHLTLFQPELPAKKRLAIENLGFGVATKLFYEFEQPWWTKDYEGTFLLWNDHNYTEEYMEYWRQNITKEELMEEIDGIPLWCRSILNIFIIDSNSHPNMIRIWLTGGPSRFLDTMDPAYIQSNVMHVLHKFLDQQFPNITEPIRAVQSKWFSNPFVRGAYSYRTMDSEELDVWAYDIAVPILHEETRKPLICFAGEATHQTFFSTVHGAYDSGVREFHRIHEWYASPA